MITRRFTLAGLVALFTFPVAADSVKLLSPSEANEKKNTGEVALVDVREPHEWKESGVAQGAALIAMRDPAIDAKFAELSDGDKTAPIALICRTGIRSAAVAKYLKSRGYTNVYSVDGGMYGSSSNPGWRRGGLPVEGVE